MFSRCRRGRDWGGFPFSRCRGRRRRGRSGFGVHAIHAVHEVAACSRKAAAGLGNNSRQPSMIVHSRLLYVALLEISVHPNLFQFFFSNASFPSFNRIFAHVQDTPIIHCIVEAHTISVICHGYHNRARSLFATQHVALHASAVIVTSYVCSRLRVHARRRHTHTCHLARAHPPRVPGWSTNPRLHYQTITLPGW